MKTKIEIKSIFGKVLFEYEKENNTIKETLQEAVRQKTDLHSADLHGADLSGANLCGAKLYGADLRDANLRDANLFVADLCCANLCGAKLYGADLRDANLRDANLSDANLRDANLSDANLRDANLDGANLCGTNLMCANLDGANLHDAKIKHNGILLVGNIGSRGGYTTAYNTDKGIYIKCGCFFGTTDEFVERVKETHKNNIHERNYLAMVDFIKICFK
jgi:uncharacterized protein YjbI with pentapeptide repeats